MSRVGTDSVSQAIGSLYEAAYDPGTWPETIETLRDLFGGSKACLARQGPNLQPSDAISTAADPVYTRRFIEEFAGEPHALLAAFGAMPVGRIYSDHALVGWDLMRSSRFWNEWLAPQDMYGGLACKLFAANGSSWFFDVQRGRKQETFDGAEVRLFERLKPHLQRVARLNWQMQAAGVLASAFTRLPFAMLLVDGHQQVVSLNEAAEALVARGDLVLRGGRLSVHGPGRGRALQALIADACSEADGVPGAGGDLLVMAADGHSPRLAVSVAPLKGGSAESLSMGCLATVMVRDLCPAGTGETLARLRGLFGFTPKEAEIAVALLAGQPLRDAAAGTGIGITTARTHIANMLRKTHTAGQVQLVALLARATG